MTVAIIDTETTGLNPMDARLVAIGLRVGNKKIVLTNDNEASCMILRGLQNFMNLLKIVG